MPSLKYKYLMNRFLLWPGGINPSPIPIRFENAQTPDGRVRRRHVMNMDHVHSLPVPDVSPRVVTRAPGMTQQFFEALQTHEYQEAIKRRVEAAELRRFVKNYVASGVIEIVEDESGFLSDVDAPSAAEVAVANSDLASAPSA